MTSPKLFPWLALWLALFGSLARPALAGPLPGVDCCCDEPVEVSACCEPATDDGDTETGWTRCGCSVERSSPTAPPEARELCSTAQDPVTSLPPPGRPLEAGKERATDSSGDVHARRFSTHRLARWLAWIATWRN